MSQSPTPRKIRPSNLGTHKAGGYSFLENVIFDIIFCIYVWLIVGQDQQRQKTKVLTKEQKKADRTKHESTLVSHLTD